MSELIAGDQADIPVKVKGWVRNKRESKNVIFISLNDGSTIKNLQVVGDPQIFAEHLTRLINTGCSLAVSGNLQASQGQGQAVELQAEEIELLGEADPEMYPLQPKKHSLEFLREIAHLRPRSQTFGAVFRVRHALIYAVHTFFHERGFYNIHTPIITGSDAEGAGEMFRVTTLDPQRPPLTEQSEVDHSQDFFGRETNLTVSGQLEAEVAAQALGLVYTFGPTFRAENSNTSRHLAEFWMIEPEMAFYDLNDNMDLAEDFLKYLTSYALEHCQDDLAFLDKRNQEEENQKPQHLRQEMTLIERLQFVSDNKFERVTYTEAIEILRNSKPHKKKKFQFLIEGWGTDLQSEHERYLVEKHFKKPVILFDYPKEIKSFYMRMNEDGKTVAAMDVLFPGIGEVIGGSQREERLQQLKDRMKEMNVPEQELWWYLELRKFGTVPHSGFGLGFERLVQFVTGMTNIRDVIPFPRTPGNAEF
ncbi:MAG: asparagine--tRNA ligase [Cyclobacteriaceae bacterium]|nr:asparagine--tRNA ligase [Cyclobacteriaceae bacterium]